MFKLEPSFDTYSETFIEENSEVVKALADIHESLMIQLLFEVILASNEKMQHYSGYSPINSIVAGWQANITTFLREKLVALNWRKHDGKGGVAYIISPCKKHAIRVMSGNKYVGVKDGAVSNSTSKGSTLNNDIHFPNLSFEDNTKIWTLLFYKHDEVMRLELSSPITFHKGKIAGWKKRIKLPDIKFNIPHKPTTHSNKAEVGKIPVRRKKTG